MANEVLAMQMPTSASQLQNLTDEIRQKVGELGHVETILQQSAGDIYRAEELLEQAVAARWVDATVRMAPIGCTLTSCDCLRPSGRQRQASSSPLKWSQKLWRKLRKLSWAPAAPSSRPPPPSSAPTGSCPPSVRCRRHMYLERQEQELTCCVFT